MKRILVVDDVHPVLLDIVRRHGFTCDYQPDITRDQALLILPEYEALVIRSKFLLTHEVLEHAGKLELICRAGAGMDNIDMIAAAAFNITCINAPEGNRNAVAEHAMGLLLSLSNKLVNSDREVRQQIWHREANRGIEIKGRTVGIIGYGNTGSTFARKLQGFECRVMAYDKYKKGFGAEGVEEVSLEDIFTHADILSIHIPLTPESKGLVNSEFINRFNKPFYYLNTSRGETQRMTAVVSGLLAGKILGAGLDVLETEKFPLKNEADKTWFQALVAMDNVQFSPHTAGWTVESYEKISRVLAEKFLKFYNLSE